MTLRLIQLATEKERFVAVLEPNRSALRLSGIASTYELAMTAIRDGLTLQQAVSARLTQQRFDLDGLIAGSGTGTGAGNGTGDASGLRWLPAIDHPDPAHLYLTGTGLTHLGSAASRDKMHAKASAAAAQSDSMRMFLLGLEGGKAAAGTVGVQPEWFYKGDGSSIVAPGEPLRSPAFALDGGEEPEIAGIYVNDPAGNPRRLGFCLANEFSDHVTERGNYLWLAHSKLRAAALGAELLTGALPADVRGVSRILRGGRAALGEALPDRRDQHVALDRQPGTSSFQVSAVSPPGRRARALLRHGNAVVRRRRARTGRRCVRDRGRCVHVALAQSFGAGDRRRVAFRCFVTLMIAFTARI